VITSFEGVMGSGKSTACAALAYTEFKYRNKKVISNNHLSFPHQFFDTRYFLDNLDTAELSDCVLVLDEAYLYLDGRTSASKLNKLFTYFIAQTRKRNVDLYICTHHIDVVDKRLRRAIDVRGTCRYRGEPVCSVCVGALRPEGVGSGVDADGNPCPACLGYGTRGWVTVRFFDLRTGRRSKARIFGNSYWHLFNTEELVPFTGKQKKISLSDL